MDKIKFSENGEELLIKEKNEKKKIKVKRKINYGKIMEVTADIVEFVIDLCDI